MAEISVLLSLAQNDVAVAALLFAGTATLVAFCVPGGIVTMAASAGAALEGWVAVPLVTLGALAGSQILFLGLRRAGAERVRARLGDRLHRFEQSFARYGLWYVVGLRVCGAPHFLVTAGSALLTIRPAAFAAATAIGFLPTVALAAAAASIF